MSPKKNWFVRFFMDSYYMLVHRKYDIYVAILRWGFDYDVIRQASLEKTLTKVYPFNWIKIRPFPNDRITWGSKRHDLNLYMIDNHYDFSKRKRGDAHWQWLKDVWSGPRREPGPIGQAYRLIGTVGFGLFGLLDR